MPLTEFVTNGKCPNQVPPITALTEFGCDGNSPSLEPIGVKSITLQKFIKYRELRKLRFIIKLIRL